MEKSRIKIRISGLVLIYIIEAPLNNILKIEPPIEPFLKKFPVQPRFLLGFILILGVLTKPD